MKRYEVKYYNLEFPLIAEFNLPFIEAPEVKNEEELAKLQADASLINEYFFPGLSEVLLAVEFVARNRFIRSTSETIDHVESILEKELQARENFPATAYFRGANSMLELHKMLPRVGDRVKFLTKMNVESERATEDPVIEQLQYAIEFHSLMVDIQTALAGIKNQKLEKELAVRDDYLIDHYSSKNFVPAKEFADFSLTETDVSITDEEVGKMFVMASMTSPTNWDLDFFQRVAEMMRARGVDVHIEVELPIEEMKKSLSENQQSGTQTQKKKRSSRGYRRKPRSLR